jgi:hypothetical protein
MMHEVWRKMMAALTMAEKAVEEPRKMRPYICDEPKLVWGATKNLRFLLTVIKLAESTKALTGTSNFGWTRSQNCE